jgi:hypothetical protein
MFTRLLILTVVVFAKGVVSYNFSCVLPSSSSAHIPLPNITNQFTVHIEANIENKGYTVNSVEYYDEPNDRGRLDFSGGSYGESSVIYNYDEQEWLHINATHCTAYPLLSNTTFLAFPVNFDIHGNAHIRGIADVLKFGKKYGESYIGQDEVRGIKADEWKTCMDTRSGGTMSVHWFFEADTWTMDGHKTPLRMVVEGMDRSTPQSDNQADWHYFKHSYDFVFYEPGPSSNSVFQIPRGMFCAGTKIAKNIPTISEQFTAQLQMVDVLGNSIYHITEVRDPDNKQFVFRSPQLTVVQDFRLGVGFFLSAHNCTTLPLSVSLLYQFSGEQSIARLSPDKMHLQMKSARDLFGMSSDYNVSYVGTRMVNDIPCDVFAEERNDFPHPGNTTIIELSFARKSLGFVSSTGFSQHQLPVRYEQYSKSLIGRLLNAPSTDDFHQIFNIFDFTVSTNESERIDVERCYTSSVTVWFELNGKFDSLLATNKRVFAKAIADSVASAAQVDISRVTRITPIKLGDGLLIQVTLLGFLNNSNLTTYVSTGVPIDEAITNLQETIDNEELAVIVNQTRRQYWAVSNSFTTSNPALNCRSDAMTSSPTSPQSRTQLYATHSDQPSVYPTPECPNRSKSPGCAEALAALGLAMFIMGFALGCLIFCFIIHRKRTHDHSYDPM